MNYKKERNPDTQTLDTSTILYVNMKFERWNWRDTWTRARAHTCAHKGQFPAERNGLTGKMHSLSGVVVEEGLGITLHLSAYSVVLWKTF